MGLGVFGATRRGSQVGILPVPSFLGFVKQGLGFRGLGFRGVGV